MSMSRSLLRGLVWGFLVSAIVLLVVLTLRQRSGPEAPPAPPVIQAVPDFTLINRDGGSVSLADLAGAPWIADFIFTRCAGPCPLMSRNFEDLGERLPEGVRRVSFSVDPEYDTPEVLAAYAARFNAGPDWLFLTGERDEVRNLAVEGFLLGVYPAEEGAEGQTNDHGPFLHSTRSVLVDAQGQIRGYFDLFEEGAIERLLAEVSRVNAGE